MFIFVHVISLCVIFCLMCSDNKLHVLWMIVYPYSHRQLEMSRVGATFKRKAYNEIYKGNSSNVCICIHIYDNLNNWRISLMVDRCLDSNIVLPHICQIMRLMNKTPPLSMMPTGTEHVFGPHNAPFNSLELCIKRRTIASYSNALPIWLYMYMHFALWNVMFTCLQNYVSEYCVCSVRVSGYFLHFWASPVNFIQFAFL